MTATCEEQRRQKLGWRGAGGYSQREKKVSSFPCSCFSESGSNVSVWAECHCWVFYSFLMKLRQNNETCLGPAPWTGFRVQAKGSCLWGWGSGWEDRLSLAGLQVLRPKASGAMWGERWPRRSTVLASPCFYKVCVLLSLSGTRGEPSA